MDLQPTRHSGATPTVSPKIAPQGYADENGACNAGSLGRGDRWAISQCAAVGAIEPAIMDTRELTKPSMPTHGRARWPRVGAAKKESTA
jgi:hypothetical protein